MKDLEFIETMRVVDGRIANLQDHLNRMQRTIREVFGLSPDFNTLEKIDIPHSAKKCRIIYTEQIQSIEFGDYQPRCINSLKVVEANSDLDYHLKYSDRTELTKLQNLRGNCDEVLIVKNGYITDTSFSNVVFTDGKLFVTPDTYLLPGTMRARLLNSGIMTETPIRTEDIALYTHIALINAMLPLESAPLIPINNICF